MVYIDDYKLQYQITIFHFKIVDNTMPTTFFLNSFQNVNSGVPQTRTSGADNAPYNKCD